MSIVSTYYSVSKDVESNITTDEKRKVKTNKYNPNTREQLVSEITKLCEENKEMINRMNVLNYQTQLYCVRIEEANKKENRLNDEICRIHSTLIFHAIFLHRHYISLFAA